MAIWAGQFVNTSHHEEATVVNVTCVDGKVFADGSTLAVSQCTEDGVWDPKVPDCIGKGRCQNTVSTRPPTSRVPVYFIKRHTRYDVCYTVYETSA